jgi:aryl-alcohol dehydrogenase-like predicted oxidoreductase
MSLRPLGQTAILVSPVAFGGWPISGMSSVGVTQANSLATLQACLEVGINFFDTAYCYGANGESERLIGQVVAGRRDQVALATKGGIHWGEKGERVIDGRPATLRSECQTSLRRLGVEHVELLYLHAPDPTISIRESAGELRRLMDEGLTRSVGVSNVTLEQLEEFAAECPVTAVQPPYNLLQRQIEEDILPWCRQRGVSVIPYWPLMKGLLAGKLPRDHKFEPGDGAPSTRCFRVKNGGRIKTFSTACARSPARRTRPWPRSR